MGDDDIRKKTLKYIPSHPTEFKAATPLNINFDLVTAARNQ